MQVKIIAGREYSSWVATWAGLDGKKRTKNFSTNKFGMAQSKQMAIDYRLARIAELNALGAEYADSHGTDKGLLNGK